VIYAQLYHDEALASLSSADKVFRGDARPPQGGYRLFQSMCKLERIISIEFVPPPVRRVETYRRQLGIEVRLKDHNLERLDDPDFADTLENLFVVFHLASLCESNFGPREHAPRQARLAGTSLRCRGRQGDSRQHSPHHSHLALASTEDWELFGGD
jgi:hypothetical protein